MEYMDYKTKNTQSQSTDNLLFSYTLHVNWKIANPWYRRTVLINADDNYMNNKRVVGSNVHLKNNPAPIKVEQWQKFTGKVIYIK